MERLAAYLRQERKLRGYDVRTLVGKSGVTNAQISRIENGKSQISMEALVRLSFGLGVEFTDVLMDLVKTDGEDEKYVGTFHSCLDYEKSKNSLKKTSEETPGASEIYALLRCYRNQFQKAEGILKDGLQVIKSHTALENIALLPYPQEFNSLDTVHAHHGVITLSDLAQAIRVERQKDGRSQRQYASDNLSYSTIGRIERGFLGRLLFSQILELDAGLECGGRLLAYAWNAEEYKAGIAISKAKSDWDWRAGWDPKEKSVADAFITICRWRSVLDGDHTWWQETMQILDAYRE